MEGTHRLEGSMSDPCLPATGRSIRNLRWRGVTVKLFVEGMKSLGKLKEEPRRQRQSEKARERKQAKTAGSEIEERIGEGERLKSLWADEDSKTLEQMRKKSDS